MPRNRSNRRAPWATAIFFGFASLAFAEKAAEPSDDFLAYLGDLENDDDNWSDFANDETMKSHSSASSASSASSTRSSSPAQGGSHL